MALRRVLCVLVVALAACGGGDGGDGSSSSPSSRSSAEGGAALTTASPPSSAPEAPEGPFAEGRTPLPGFGEVAVRIVEGPDGEPVVICVLVADTPAERAQGLMRVTDLGGYDGMLFRFPSDSDGGFWMKDTLLPLSIAYLDADGAVVTTADMEPCPDGTDCPSYPAAAPYRTALEVPQGRLADLGLVEGGTARLVLDGPCAPRPG